MSVEAEPYPLAGPRAVLATDAALLRPALVAHQLAEEVQLLCEWSSADALPCRHPVAANHLSRSKKSYMQGQPGHERMSNGNMSLQSAFKGKLMYT